MTELKLEDLVLRFDVALADAALSKIILVPTTENEGISRALLLYYFQ